MNNRHSKSFYETAAKNNLTWQQSTKIPNEVWELIWLDRNYPLSEKDIYDIIDTGHCTSDFEDLN